MNPFRTLKSDPRSNPPQTQTKGPSERSKELVNQPRRQLDVDVQGDQTLAATHKPSNEPQIAVDGFRQVLDMLRVADPEFRESLLRRLADRDKNLVRNLRRDLGI